MLSLALRVPMSSVWRSVRISGKHFTFRSRRLGALSSLMSVNAARVCRFMWKRIISVAVGEHSSVEVHTKLTK